MNPHHLTEVQAKIAFFATISTAAAVLACVALVVVTLVVWHIATERS